MSKTNDFWMPSNWSPPSHRNPYSSKYRNYLQRVGNTKHADEFTEEEIVERVKRLLSR